MKTKAVTVLSYGRRYAVAINAISEHLPSLPHFARAQHIRACARFHQTTCLLIHGDTVYFSQLAGISIAAQLEAHLTTAHASEEVTAVCVPFDESIYVCEYDSGLVMRERMLIAEDVPIYLEQQIHTLLLIPMGILSKLFSDKVQSCPAQLLRLSNSPFGAYKLVREAQAMWFSGMPTAQHVLMLVLMLCATILTAKPYFEAPDRTDEISAAPLNEVLLPVRPTHYTSSASQSLERLNHVVTQLQAVARQLEISVIDVNGTMLRVQSAQGEIVRHGTSWGLSTTPVPQVTLLESHDVKQLRRTFAGLPGAILEDWHIEREAHAQLVKVRMQLEQGISWHIDILSKLLSYKPAEIETARVVFDNLGRVRSAKLVIHLRSRVG